MGDHIARCDENRRIRGGFQSRPHSTDLNGRGTPQHGIGRKRADKNKHQQGNQPLRLSRTRPVIAALRAVDAKLAEFGRNMIHSGYVRNARTIGMLDASRAGKSPPRLPMITAKAMPSSISIGVMRNLKTTSAKLL